MDQEASKPLLSLGALASFRLPSQEVRHGHQRAHPRRCLSPSPHTHLSRLSVCQLASPQLLLPGCLSLESASCLLPLSSLILRFRSPFLQPRLIFPTVSASPPPTSAEAPRYLLLLSVSPPRSSRPLSPHIWSLQPLSPTCPCRSLSRLSLPSLAVSLILSPLESPLLPVSSHQHRRCS